MNSKYVPLLALALAGLLSSCQGRPSSSKAAPKPAPGATVAYLEGSVTQDGKILAIGDAVLDGALLQTDGNALAEIVFDGKNALRVGPNASLRLRLAELAKTVEVERGTVTAVLRKLNKLSGGKLEVRTPSLVAGVRGTSFCAWVSGKESETYFCTCNGRIEFVPGGTAEPIIEEAHHHDALVFRGAGENVTVVPAPADMNPRHNDADLERLAALIGETMDWTRVEE